MTRANGFAVFRGPSASLLADKGIARVRRFGRETILDGRGTRSGTVIVARSVEDGEPQLPLIHGLVTRGYNRDGEPERGEFAFLAERGGRMFAGRDALGTRPIFTNEDGSVVASDHRFISGCAPRLLRRGATVDLQTLEVHERRTVPAAGRGVLHESVETLAGLLVAAVERRVSGLRRVAVAFSGGLDSSLIVMLAARHARVVLCSAYTTSSRDERGLAAAAEALGLEIRSARLDSPAIAAELESLDLPFEVGSMDRALWCLYSATARIAAEEGAEVMLLGQLADELFGGYMKYSIAALKDEERAAAMMAADVEACGVKAFVRDEQTCARFIEPRFPFADEDVVGFALGLPVSDKISGGQRKLILRLAASNLGLPEQLAKAPKKAAQYSSGIGKLLP